MRRDRLGIRAASVPSRCPVPHIGSALDEQGHAQDERLDRALTRFLDTFCWYARALKSERALGTPY